MKEALFRMMVLITIIGVIGAVDGMEYNML